MKGGVEVKFSPAVAGHVPRGFWIIPMGQLVEVLGAKKQRYWGCFESDK